MSQERQPYSNIRRVQRRCAPVDMHEVMKQEIYRQSYDADTNFRFGLGAGTTSTSGGSVGGVIPPAAGIVGFEDTELYFDSVGRDTSSDTANGELKFSITNINNNQDLRNCIELMVTPMYFPRISNPAVPAAPDYFFYRRVYMQITNLPSTQGILATNGNQFHFEFEVMNISSIAVLLVPLKNTFFLQRPITSLSEIDVRFMVPHGFRRIPLPKDTLAIASVSPGTNPARFLVLAGDTTAALGPIGVPVAPGVAVYITNFVSPNGLINAQVNAAAGLFVTNIIDAFTFEVAGIDLTPLGVASYNATAIVPKNRIAFSMRFTSTRDQLTNYIVVGHE